jgi:membrane-associated protein
MTPADLLSQAPAPAAYAILSLALLIESNLLFGVFVPTLTLMVTAGALAGSGHLSLPVVLVVAAASVVTADVISFNTGRFLGPRLRTNRMGRRVSTASWQRTEAVMARHGGRAVFVARFIPLLRTLVPHLAGATRLPYRRIAPYSVTAATVWAFVEAGAGYGAAHSLHRIAAAGTPALIAAALAGVLATAIVVVLRARRRAAATSRAASVTSG